MNRIKRRLKWAPLGVVLLAGALQFTNPALTNPPVVPGRALPAADAPSPKVAAIVRDACFDCHSNETRWPWYSHVAPVSWWIVDHVKDGRRRLNFSDWPNDDPQRARKAWWHIDRAVRSGHMPLTSYTWIHTDARLTPAQRKLIVQWAEQELRGSESAATGDKHL